MIRGAHLAALAVALLALAPPCRASLFDTYGHGARGTAMGGAMVAQSTDYEAVYYNPANLLTRKAAHFGLGINILGPALEFDRLSGTDPVSPRIPETNVGFQVGAATSIGGVFEDRLGFGVTLFHPLLRLTRIESIDPGHPTFYRYDSLPDKLILAAALAGEPFEWLRIGAGLQILAGLGGSVTAGVSLGSGKFTQETIDIDVDVNAAPTFGLTIGPLWGVRLGATWRSHLELEYHLPVDVDIEEIGQLDVQIDGVSLYTPDQLAIGLSWESAPPGDPGVTVEAGLTWERWSAAPSNLAAFDLTLTDSNLRAEENAGGRDVQELIDVQAAAIPLGALDTVTARLGGEWRPDAAWAVRAGYFYRPTPLPRPIYQTNIFDASAHVLSLGGGFMFRDPTRMARSPLRIDLGIQLTVLHDRTIHKAADGTPDGSYRMGGSIWNATLDLRHDF